MYPLLTTRTRIWVRHRPKRWESRETESESYPPGGKGSSTESGLVPVNKPSSTHHQKFGMRVCDDSDTKGKKDWSI